jgi:type VI secretion system secreted protein Hcp
MPIYMQYEGIDGDVTAAGHEKWIELTSLSWGINRNITTPQTGGNADREAQAPTVQEISIMKISDTSSHKLMLASLEGEGKKVKIDFVRTDKDKLEAYHQYELENTLVSGFSVSGSSGDRPVETIQLNFTKIIFTNTPAKDKNETGSPEKVGYNLATATTL